MDGDRKLIILLIAALVSVSFSVYLFVPILGGQSAGGKNKKDRSEKIAVSDKKLFLSRGAPAVNGTIQAEHAFEGGVHKLRGLVNAPGSCDSVRASVDTPGPAGGVGISFIISNAASYSAAGAGACEDVVTPTAFYVSFDSPEFSDIRASVNGVPVSLELKEVESVD